MSSDIDESDSNTPQPINLQDSVIGGDVIQTTIINVTQNTKDSKIKDKFKDKVNKFKDKEAEQLTSPIEINMLLNEAEISGIPTGPTPPTYTVRPNHSIPITIGILMLIGSLIVAALGSTYIMGHFFKHKYNDKFLTYKI